MPSIVIIKEDMIKDMKPGCAGWMSYINQRIYRQQKNFLCLVSGQTGSGKSWACLSIAEMLTPEGKKFPLEHIVFSVKELIQLVRHGNLKRGDLIIFEESGVGAFKQNWHSANNKALGALLQTFRNMGIIVFFNVPSAWFMDSNAKRLIHSYWETTRINSKTSECIFDSKLIQVNEKTNKTYYKNLRLGFIGYPGMIKPIKGVAIPKPSKELIEVYEEKKKMFQCELYDKLEAQLNAADAKEEIAMKPKIKYFCIACGHTWTPRSDTPKYCSDCRSKRIEVMTKDSVIELTNSKQMKKDLAM